MMLPKESSHSMTVRLASSGDGRYTKQYPSKSEPTSCEPIEKTEISGWGAARRETQ